MKDEPQTLEGDYEKALSELKWKIQLDSSSEYEDQPMEKCHCRRRVPLEAVSRATSKNDNKHRYKENSEKR